MPLEREIKLRFASADEARERILSPGVGATPLRGRRLQEDSLLDTADNRVYQRSSVLRVRTEGGKSLLTFKGPVQPGAMKLREEHETVVADGDTLLTILHELGLHVWFRYEKYREEFAAEDVVIAIDETPVGDIRRDRRRRGTYPPHSRRARQDRGRLHHRLVPHALRRVLPDARHRADRHAVCVDGRRRRRACRGMIDRYAAVFSSPALATSA